MEIKLHKLSTSGLETCDRQWTTLENENVSREDVRLSAYTHRKKPQHPLVAIFNGKRTESEENDES